MVAEYVWNEPDFIGVFQAYCQLSVQILLEVIKTLNTLSGDQSHLQQCRDIGCVLCRMIEACPYKDSQWVYERDRELSINVRDLLFCGSRWDLQYTGQGHCLYPKGCWHRQSYIHIAMNTITHFVPWCYSVASGNPQRFRYSRTKASALYI